MSIYARNPLVHMSVVRQGQRGLASIMIPLALMFGGSAPVVAANVDIASSPMASGTSVDVKPNIMFVLDDSGSMAQKYLPEAAGTFPSGAYGHASAACNALYFNPAITYTPPVDANGNSLGNASFEAAKQDGYNPNSPAVNLATSFQAYDSGCSVTGGALCDTPQAAYYYSYPAEAQLRKQDPRPLEYVYTGTGSTDTRSGIYPLCSEVPGKGGGASPFTKVTVANGARQNFANWYSYYRTRINAMKTAAGRAFSQLPNPDGLRIGFSTHSETAISPTQRFQPLGDFCAAGSAACQPSTQRADIFQKLYGTTAESGVQTPLRSSMAKIGRMYAGFDGSSRLSSSQDPIQYSCQQNFLIMATDGAWNQDVNANFNIQNNAGVGDQDGSAQRPMYDHLKVPNTLADVAKYYYKTDLRDGSLSNCTGSVTGQDVCTNNVPSAGRDDASTQHMTTFTLGFGVDGSLAYAENYEGGGSLDFNGILSGSKNWPDPRPQDAADNFFRVDDLWHAAVNGRGTYYSAKTPDSLIAGLTRAMGTAVARSGSGSGSATSNLEPVAGDNYAYVASYRTSRWDGDLQARTIDLVSGGLATEQDRVWSAKEKLDNLIATATQGFAARKIYMKGSGSTARLDFNATNVGSTYSATRPAELTDAVIDFIRGDSSREDQPGNATRTFRDRAHALGDVVSSHPVFVGRPPFKYSDAGYTDFAAATAQQSRAGIVLVGANDGMLHAFDSQTGDELWAYVPGAVIPNLHKLASPTYGQSAATPHQYYVDGVIAVGDICVATNCTTASASDWRTIAVVGLGKGGRSYFALDITNTANPQVLWEFSDDNLGLSFGNPIITKRNGEWVVIFASGYNNVSPGDGQGRLFVLNAKTGAKVTEIVAGTGNDPAVTGLAKISNWVDNIRLDDSTRYVYGGDLSGRLWRFDLRPASGSGTATELAVLTGPGQDARRQPITTRPEMAEVKASNGNLHRVVFVGTGKFLGVSDLSDTSVQSLYAVKDSLSDTGWGDFRSATGVVQQEMTASGNTRTITNRPVDWTTSPGWFVDFLLGGERIDIDFKLVNGVLTVVTNVPENGACVVGGKSYIYFFDNRTGSYVRTVEGSIVGRLLSQALGVGLSVIRVAGRDVAIVNTSDNRQISVPVPAYSSSGTFRRMMWRELVD